MRPTVIETDVYVNSIGPVDPINMVRAVLIQGSWVCLTAEWGNVWIKMVDGEIILFSDWNYYYLG